MYCSQGQDQKAYEDYIRKIENYEEYGLLPLQAWRIAYALWQVGEYEQANFYFNEAIKFGEESIRLGRDYATTKGAHYDLAGIYAFNGDREKAYQYLDEFSNRKFFFLGWVTLLKNDPLFDSIRDEPEFQQIVRDVEVKYQAEHERVRQWLEANDM